MINNLLFFKECNVFLKSLLLISLLLIGISGFSQNTSKAVAPVASKSIVTQPLGNVPMQGMKQTQNDLPEVPANYTATRVSLGANATEEAKAAFFKQHNADYYYIYNDPKGKVVSRDEVSAALKKQNEASGLNSNSILSPKK